MIRLWKLFFVIKLKDWTLLTFAKIEMPTRDNTFATIGVLVVTTQTVERMLNMLLTFVLQNGVPLSYSRLMELNSKHRRRTLGYFIREMQKRATFQDDIDSVLERFLESRNSLIHRFDDIPGSALESDDDRKELRSFLAQLAADTETLMAFCAALIQVWSKEIGMSEKFTIEHYLADGEDGFLGRILAMADCMDLLVSPKEQNKANNKDAPSNGG